MTSMRGKWIWAVVGLALGCAGPGLEPPGRENDGHLEPGGVGGSAGSAGNTGGAGMMSAAGTDAPPIDNPALDAGTEPQSELDAASDASTIDDDGGGTYESRELVGPSYMGSVDNGPECSMSYPTRGHEP